MEKIFITEKGWLNEVVLKEYHGSDGRVVIPEGVAEIGMNVFKGHEEIEEVYIPEGVKSIGWGAFQDCTRLKEIKIPSTVYSIGNYAFSGCTSLSKVILPEKITTSFVYYFNSKAFNDCISLTEFTIPKDIVYICGDLFDGCKGLKRITFMDRSVKITGKELRNICDIFRNNAVPEQLETPVVKRGLMSTAAKNILDEKCDDVYKEAWVKYIKSQRKPCFEQIKKDKYLSKLAIQEKILKPQELDAEPEKKEIVSYDISSKEARNKYNFSKRQTGYSINDFNKDGRIDGPYMPDSHYVFLDFRDNYSKVVFIPNTIDGKPVGHVAVKTLPFDAIVICDAATFGKLDRRVKASTAAAYLEDETQFKKDEAEKIVEFIKKNPLDIAKVIINSESPKAYSRFIELGKPNKETISQMIESVKDKKEITALLLNASGQKQETVELGLAPKKQISIADIKKEWAYDKKTIDINGDYVEGIYLKKYKGINPDVDIPDTIGKNTVLAVGASAFENCNILESVTVPGTVKLIDNQAFAGCTKLKKAVIFGENVKIGRLAFYDCTSLNELVLSVSTTRFDYHPFKGCSKLLDDKGLVILEGEDGNVLVDSKWPFDYSEITIPEGVTRIDGQAFADQHDEYDHIKQDLILRKVVLPSTIKEIGNSVFDGCEILQEVVMPEGLEIIRERAFNNCTMLREVHIPQSAKEIETYNYIYHPFTNCQKLKIFGYPGSEAERFASDKKIPFVAEEASTVKKNLVVDFVIDDGVLIKYLGKEVEVTIPAGVDKIGFGAFGHNSYVEAVTIPEGVKQIDELAFNECENLKTVVLPGSLTSIEFGAFEFCYDLKNLNLPEGLKSIGESAFAYTGIKKITIPASVESLGERLFTGCSELESIINFSSVELQDNQ